MWGLTPVHLVVILVIVLIIVGPGKLPDTGAALGKALRGFKDAMDGSDSHQAAAAQQPAPPAQPPAQYVPAQPQVQYPPQQPYPAQTFQPPVAPAPYASPAVQEAPSQPPVAQPEEPPRQG